MYLINDMSTSLTTIEAADVTELGDEMKDFETSNSPIIPSAAYHNVRINFTAVSVYSSVNHFLGYAILEDPDRMPVQR